MYRKSVVVPALVAGVLFTMSACGSSDGGSDGAGGVKAGPGVTANQIKIGILTDYSGPIAEAATGGSAGTEVYFDQVNAAGGVCGRKIVAVKGDTKYDPQQTVQAYRAMSKDVLAISQLIGSASIAAIKDSIKRDEMPTFAVSLNTYTAGLPDVYVPVPTFEVELGNGVIWATQEAKTTKDNPLKIGAVTTGDDFGKVYLSAIKAAADSVEGADVVSEPTVSVADKDFTAQASELKAKGAQVVLLGTNAVQTAGIVGASAQLGYDPIWIAESGGWNDALAEPLKGLLNKFYVSNGYASLVDQDIPGIKAVTEAMKKYQPNTTPNNFSVAGWLFGTVTVEALKKACEDKDLTREGVTKALKDLKVDYQGITPEVDMGDGDTIVSFNSRINRLGSKGEQIAVTDFFESDAVKAWWDEANPNK